FERHPGMLRIGWVPRVNRKERAEYEAAAITDGVSGYRIKSLQGDAFASAPQSDEYFPVFYSTQPKTSSVYAMDYATVPARRAGPALVGQSQDRRHRLAGAGGSSCRRSAGDDLRSRGRGADRRHAADAVAFDLSHARKPQFAAAVAGEPAGARTRPDRHPERTAE